MLRFCAKVKCIVHSLSISNQINVTYACPPRQFTYDDLRQLFRSVGCVSDEIRVECIHDINTTVVIENATFYSVPDENWLNCSRGPLGPLAMGGLAASASEVELGSLGRQQNIFAGVSGFSSLTNVRYYDVLD